MEQFISMKGGNIARRQAPQHTVHGAAGAWGNRSPAIETDEEAIAIQHGRTKGTSAGNPSPASMRIEDASGLALPASNGARRRKGKNIPIIIGQTLEVRQRGRRSVSNSDRLDLAAFVDRQSGGR